MGGESTTGGLAVAARTRREAGGPFEPFAAAQGGDPVAELVDQGGAVLEPPLLEGRLPIAAQAPLAQAAATGPDDPAVRGFTEQAAGPSRDRGRRCGGGGSCRRR